MGWGWRVAGWPLVGLLQVGLLPSSIADRLADVGDFRADYDVRGVNINDSNFAIIERLAHWQAAEGMARDNPRLGVGLGNYGAAYERYGLVNWPNALGHAHMIYLNVLAETGVIGLTAYLGLWAGGAGAHRARHRNPPKPTTSCQAPAGGAGWHWGCWAAWVHLSAHQVVDNLYVNNIHFTLAVLLGLLSSWRGPPPPIAPSLVTN